MHFRKVSCYFEKESTHRVQLYLNLYNISTKTEIRAPFWTTESILGNQIRPFNSVFSCLIVKLISSEFVFAPSSCSTLVWLCAFGSLKLYIHSCCAQFVHLECSLYNLWFRTIQFEFICGLQDTYLNGWMVGWLDC